MMFGFGRKATVGDLVLIPTVEFGTLSMKAVWKKCLVVKGYNLTGFDRVGWCFETD